MNNFNKWIDRVGLPSIIAGVFEGFAAIAFLIVFLPGGKTPEERLDIFPFIGIMFVVARLLHVFTSAAITGVGILAPIVGLLDSRGQPLCERHRLSIYIALGVLFIPAVWMFSLTVIKATDDWLLWMPEVRGLIGWSTWGLFTVAGVSIAWIILTLAHAQGRCVKRERRTLDA